MSYSEYRTLQQYHSECDLSSCDCMRRARVQCSVQQHVVVWVAMTFVCFTSGKGTLEAFRPERALWGHAVNRKHARHAASPALVVCDDVLTLPYSVESLKLSEFFKRSFGFVALLAV